MVDINNAQDKEVKVEDLLRLKRQEKPDDAFWNAFDCELHQRMLQTLVKKDPWYVQILRGASGRIAQMSAVGAAAAFLAMMIVRPAFVELSQPVIGPALAEQIPADVRTAPVEVAMSDFDSAFTPDYQLDAITAGVDAGYTQEFAHDTFEVVGYDSAAYVADTATFAGTGLATGLVY
ncbi:hypothetical protein QEH59_13935 [Coraliomargarita sp. SDUM461004]|uniref:Anti sigma-E protein RseA N-terminal domain-containing protein n=1 Tax=Thalassobacterium sedimentorum TaxID=3041258 RepID=A0ABU1AMT6_9BACT|nr:hypothetical protein [Coraliomargarita sp. SDUM461004]MDQ8195528.1 hypothetical protein [Coraliomargarita sp. SDUM461004]